MTLKRRLAAAAASLALAGGLLLFFREASAAAGDLIALAAAAGPWARLAYILLVSATVLLIVPGAILPMGGGFLFGVAQGTGLFVVGELIGAVLAFGIARHFLGGRLRRRFLRHPRLDVLEAALAGEGWRMIAMTRLVPFFPFKLSNYFFGSMGVRFRDFFWGTLIGTLPLSLLLVHLGSLTAEVAALGDGTAWENPGTLAWMVALAAAGLAGLVLVSRRVGRVYRTRMEASREKSAMRLEGEGQAEDVAQGNGLVTQGRL